MPFRLRMHEWVLLSFFAYIALLSVAFKDRPHLHFQPAILLAAFFVFFALLSRAETGKLRRAVAIVRDWLPMVLILVAFREMEIFVPRSYDLKFETGWIRLDELVLLKWGLRSAIESLGKAIPFYLEFCYLLVYGLGAYGMAWIAVKNDRRLIDWFWTVYYAGTLAAYGLFPYFPSLPPRYAFPAVAPPTVTTWVRTFNLALLRGVTIHSGVFPSAHVSSAFSSAWALYLIFPTRRWLGHSMLGYAVSVSLATLYGRYHYLADVLAGFGASLVAAAVCFALRRYADRSFREIIPVKRDV